MIRRLLAGLPIAGALVLAALAVWVMFRKPPAVEAARGQVALKVATLNIGLWRDGLARSEAFAKFQERNPDIAVRKWSRFQLPSGMNIASEMMSFAGGTAPDVMFTYVHRLQFYIGQGFFHRLNEFIGEDRNGNGILDPDEIRWKPWLEIPPIFRQMAMRGTDIYAIPGGPAFSVMAYRRDLLSAGGVQTGQFPKDFESFLLVCQKICANSIKETGRRRIYALPRQGSGMFQGSAQQAAFFQSLHWSAGGTPGLGELRGRDGRVLGHVTPEDNVAEKARSLGLKPDDVTVEWKVKFDDEPTRRALEAIQRLCWQPWVVNPHTGDPLNLTETDLRAGEATCPKTGQRIALATVPGGIQRGVCRPLKTQETAGESDVDLLRTGEIAMMLLGNTSLQQIEKGVFNLGFALPPAMDPGGKPAVTAIPMLYGLNGILRGPKLEAAWRLLSFQCSPEWNRIVTRHLLDRGNYETVSPLDVERHGFLKDLARIPPDWVKVNREALKVAHVIPYFAGYQQAESEFFTRTVNKIVGSPGVDIPAAMRDTQKDAEERILRPANAHRGPWRQAGAFLLLGASFAGMAFGIRSVVRLPRGAVSRGTTRPIFWIFAVPALASVLIWNYYPVSRGLLLAFQDYRLVGPASWVGLANFAEAAGSARFWRALLNTAQFISLNLALGFFAPLALAVLLSEIPKGKYAFRTIFYLPAVTSSLVILLLWSVMYDPTPEGTFNQIVRPFAAAWNHLAPADLAVKWPVRWLQEPFLAMICVILPGIWAQMGGACLIYLAALQSVNSDLYEAAEIDGAGFLRKFAHITIPFLKPLLIINLVGAFVGAARAWENIFIMTGGGPDLSTQVAAMEIWMNSFLFLRFGLATAQAWALGALLVGFAVWQIRLMQRMEFRRVTRN
jgi:multiple sugar transport system permease protein